MADRTVLAVDIGAESGRVIAVHFDGSRLRAEEVNRFANVPVKVGETLHWDILRLWQDVQTGIQIGMSKTCGAAAIAVDTWGVDFGLLDSRGRLIGNPVHYRDSRTDGMLDYVFSIVPRADVFQQTGIQILPINTLYQLASLAKNNDPFLAQAATFLTIPDLLVYWLTGVQVVEFSNATTTQCYDTRARRWATDLLDKLGIPTGIFGEVASSGTIVGQHQGIPVVLAPQHDTASAVVAVPAETPNFAYLSSGTWSLLGVERPAPVISDQTYAANFTNEGGFNDSTMLLKNIMGLWLLQESRRDWLASGQDYSYAQLTDLAAHAPPFAALINPDASLFLKSGGMVERIRQYCLQTGQKPPDSVAGVVRCIFESLALAYDATVQKLSALSGQPIEVLHIVGGGSQNAVLCQMAADATGCPVIAGPGEATALGNAITQLIALGDLKSIAEGRALVGHSFPPLTYQPTNSDAWIGAKIRFHDLITSNEVTR